MMDDGIYQQFTADIFQLFCGQFPFEDVKFGGFNRFHALDIEVA